MDLCRRLCIRRDVCDEDAFFMIEAPSECLVHVRMLAFFLRHPLLLTLKVAEEGSADDEKHCC